MKPVIGVFTTVYNDGMHSIFTEYIESLAAAGGLPLIITYTDDNDSIRQLSELCDGFCFTGGVDIHPSYYGEEMLPECGDVQDKRDSLEMRAFPAVLASGKPILGICRGAQLVNVALGGTLYQDIPSQLGESFPHRQTEARLEHSHYARVLGDTPLAKLLGEGRVQINSFHHQAIKQLGEGLAVMAFADDGVVEAAYGVGEQYIRLYQWHPERLAHSDDGERALFEDFIRACDINKNK